MRMLRLGIALLLVWTASAGAAVVVAPRPVADPAANRAALQAAIDKAGSDGAGIVHFSAGTWTVDGPLFLDRTPHAFAAVGLQGLGTGISRIVMRRGLGYDVLVVGVDRRPRYPGAPEGGAALTPAHFVSTDRLLDRSAHGRWAYRTRGDTHLIQMGGPLDQGAGDWYGKPRQLTVDVAVDFPDTKSLGHAAICGLRDGIDASPWSLIMTNGRPYLTLTTRGDEADPESRNTRRIFLDPAAPLRPGLVRFTLQFDLDSPGMVAAWIDGRKATVNPQMGPPAKAGESFASNQHACFGVGSHHAMAGGLIDYQGGALDITVAGLKITGASLYDPSRATQARIDGKPLDDALRYFTDEPKLVAFLPLTAKPEAVCRDRTMAVRGHCGGQSAIGETGAYVFDNPGHASTFSGITPGLIERISIEGGDPWYGRAVALGFVNNGKFRDCQLQGGSHGLGAVTLGATYPLEISDCRLLGHDAPLFLFMTSSTSLSRLWLDGHYRAGIRLVGGSARVEGLHSPHWGTPEYGICVRGGSVRLRNISLDNEDPKGGSQIADVYVTPMDAALPLSALVEIDEMDSVYSGPKSSKVLLGGPPKRSAKRTQIGYCGIRIHGLAIHTGVPFRSAVRCIAEDLWTDEGINLADDGKPFVPFEGLPLKRPKLIDTSGSATQSGR